MDPNQTSNLVQISDQCYARSGPITKLESLQGELTLLQLGSRNEPVAAFAENVARQLEFIIGRLHEIIPPNFLKQS